MYYSVVKYSPSIWAYNPNKQSQRYMHSDAHQGLLPSFSGDDDIVTDLTDEQIAAQMQNQMDQWGLEGYGAEVSKQPVKVDETILGIPSYIVYISGGVILGIVLTKLLQKL
jgi:hypothetical protein